MTRSVSDRWIWLGCAVILYKAYQIHRVSRISNAQTLYPSLGARPLDNEEQIPSSISLDTLQTLASSPNTNVANAAVSLIIQRVALELRSSNGEFLLSDARSSCASVRRRAQAAVEFLGGFGLDNIEGIVLASSGSSGGLRSDQAVSSALRMPGGRSHVTEIALPRWREYTSERQISGEDAEMQIRRLRREAMVIRELDDEALSS